MRNTSLNMLIVTTPAWQTLEDQAWAQWGQSAWPNQLVSHSGGEAEVPPGSKQALPQLLSFSCLEAHADAAQAGMPAHSPRAAN